MINVIFVIHILHVRLIRKIFVGYLMTVAISYNVCTWDSTNYCDFCLRWIESISLRYTSQFVFFSRLFSSYIFYQKKTLEFLLLNLNKKKTFVNGFSLVLMSSNLSCFLLESVQLILLEFLIDANSDCEDNNILEGNLFLIFESRRQCLSFLFLSYLRSNSHWLFCDLSTSAMT